MTQSEQHIHYYYGNDEFAIRKQVEKFSAKFTDPTTAGMNSARLDARTVAPNDLGNAVGAMPFLASQRLVVLEYVSKGYPGLEGHKKFVAFLETVPNFTRLVIVDPEEIKDRDLANHWMIKWVGKHAEIAEARAFMLPKQKEMPGWIVAEAKRQGGSIDSEAAARLAEMTGEDTRQAALEITKLLTYVNYAHRIEVEDVNTVSVVTASVDIFKLVDAIGSQNGKEAQKLLHRTLEDTEAFELFGMVIRQFRLLIQARAILDDGGGLPDMVEKMSLHHFVAEKMLPQAKKFTMETLRAIYHRLLLMDEAAKSGGMPLDASLDMLIVELSGK